ncbi:MAG: deoxyribose-phosphate aldolase [Lachnospiraceae bacterium]|jgi:deoxyribose-phosphate aldolase|nr:deoxyribose-phosphate aldolase [Lachnospiraceae bacterium]
MDNTMLNTFTPQSIAKMIDVSAVRADSTLNEVGKVAEAAKKYSFICAFALPCFTGELVGLLKDRDDIMTGGVVGFPSGADTTEIKVAEARQLLSLGVNEIDMVINIGALKSGKYDRVRDDIKAVVDVCGVPVKSILEIAYLTDDEIRIASRLAVEAGVAFVKTGTGWADKPTTVGTIRIIKSEIGDAARIKAAGGVRELSVLLEMAEAGCSRFGIGLNSAVKIMEEAKAMQKAGACEKP